jgi:hypothetical protein
MPKIANRLGILRRDRRKTLSPTARTLALLRRQGFQLAAAVERWIPGANVRKDLFGVADVLAVHPRDRLFLLVQATSADHVAHRLRKVRARPDLALWLKAGGRFEVWGWFKRAGRWKAKRVEVRAQDLADVVLSTPGPRPRKGERQRELFD